MFLFSLQINIKKARQARFSTAGYVCSTETIVVSDPAVCFIVCVRGDFFGLVVISRSALKNSKPILIKLHSKEKSHFNFYANAYLKLGNVGFPQLYWRVQKKC